MSSRTFEGCWIDTEALIRKVSGESERYPFQVWRSASREWVGTCSAGPLPHKPCPAPDVPEARSGVPLRRWLLENPGEVVITARCVEYRFNGDMCGFEIKEPMRNWQADQPLASPCTPVRGYW